MLYKNKSNHVNIHIDLCLMYEYINYIMFTLFSITDKENHLSRIISIELLGLSHTYKYQVVVEGINNSLISQITNHNTQ